MTATIEALSDAELAKLAAGGERSAAGLLLSRRLPTLAAVARRITIPAIDADDLLAESISKMLAKWADGTGPQEAIDAYLITSMKNRVTDEIRSPRSRTTALDLVQEPADPEPAEFHQIELHRELQLISAALDKLPADQRRVLLATVVDGRKPGDLVTELGRPAGAVYALTHRAKHALQRAVLQTILAEDAETECRAHAARLPKIITPDLLSGRTDATRHIETCDHCSEGWRRYLALASVGGIACLVVVGAVMVTPAPAAVAAETPSSPTGTGGGGASATARRALRVGRLGLRPAVVALAAGTMAVSGGVLVVAGALPSRVDNAAKPTGSLAVTVASPAEARTTVNVAFSVDQPTWTIDSTTFTLPTGTTLSSAPPGWSCHTSGAATVSCTAGGENPRGGAFDFVSSATTPATYSMVLHATSNGRPITATANGPFPR